MKSRSPLARWAPAWLLVGAAVLYLFRLGHVALFDLDESVYAEISREMLVLKDWLTPHVDFVPYLEKPPLFYWLNALALGTFGLSAFSARLATALAAIAGVGFTYAIGRDIWGRRAGLAAGAVLATSFGYFVFGRMAMPDMLFTALVTATFWGISHTLLDEKPRRGPALFGYAAMGAALLAKGLIGLVLPALAVGVFVLITRDWARLRRMYLVQGGALFLLITVPWHAFMAWKYPGFLWFYVMNEHFARFLGDRRLVNYFTLPVGAYLAMTLVWLCPWTIFLPAAVRRCWPRHVAGERKERGSLLILLWAGTVIGFFALSASRLEYYALPALPALALCVGRLWDHEIGLPRAQMRRGSLAVTWLGLALFAVCLVPAAFLFPRLQHSHFYNMFPHVTLPAHTIPADALAKARVYLVPGFARLVPLFEVVIALIIVGTGAAAWAWFRFRRKLALACLVGATAVGFVILERGFLLFEPYRSVAPLAAVVREEFRPGDQILLEGAFEKHASLAFYTQRRIRMYHGDKGILVYGARYADPKGTFVSDAAFDRLWRGTHRVFLLSDDPHRWSRLEALASTTVVLGRAGNSWLFANRGRER